MVAIGVGTVSFYCLNAVVQSWRRRPSARGAMPLAVSVGWGSAKGLWLVGHGCIGARGAREGSSAFLRRGKPSCLLLRESVAGSAVREATIGTIGRAWTPRRKI